jgi:hypothetical protein
VATAGNLVLGGAEGLEILPVQCQPAGTDGDGRLCGLSVRAFPNPSPRGASLRCAIPVAGHVGAFIYDVAGRRLRTLHDGPLAAGVHDLSWDGRDDSGHDLAPGVYFARVAAAGATESRRIVILR